MTGSRGLMFGRMARYYDLLYSGKDYRVEVERLEQLTRRYGRRRARSWLDVACGTGRHLEWLRRSYTVTGVDRSEEMLRFARRRLPGVSLHRADMRTFHLTTRFDVVSCLFSAVGHLRTREELRRAFANFARHLNPGGVVVVEPWIDPAEFHPGHIALTTYRSPALVVVRMSFAARRREHSIIRYHYLVAEKGRGVRYFRESDVGLLVSRRDLVGAMRDAGLRPRFLRRGLSVGRGLVLGIKRASTP